MFVTDRGDIVGYLLGVFFFALSVADRRSLAMGGHSTRRITRRNESKVCVNGTESLHFSTADAGLVLRTRTRTAQYNVSEVELEKGVPIDNVNEQTHRAALEQLDQPVAS